MDKTSYIPQNLKHPLRVFISFAYIIVYIDYDNRPQSESILQNLS